MRYLDDLFWVPHGVFVGSILTLLALLAVQLEEDVTGIGGVVEVEPEDDASLHRRPPMTALLETEQIWRY